jgi:hypothetical protein
MTESEYSKLQVKMNKAKLLRQNIAYYKGRVKKFTDLTYNVASNISIQNMRSLHFNIEKLEAARKKFSDFKI